MTELERLRIENEFLRQGLSYYANQENYRGEHGHFWKLVANRGQIARLYLLAADLTKQGKQVDIRKLRCK